MLNRGVVDVSITAASSVIPPTSRLAFNDNLLTFLLPPSISHITPSASLLPNIQDGRTLPKLQSSPYTPLTTTQFNPGFYEDPMMGGGGMYPGMIGRTGPAQRFDEYYRCYPVAMLPGPERENVNHGGKVIMPPSALDRLTRLHITYPMLFELINGAKETTTHAGVLEFIAEEGKIYLPYWVPPPPPLPLTPP